MHLYATTKDVFHGLKKETLTLHAEWILYRQLYATNLKRIELLNESAPFFFQVVHALLIDDVALTLCKLTEPSRTRSFENLTIARLVECVEGDGLLPLAAALRAKADELHEQCAPFRAHRDKRIAHLDLRHALRVPKEPLHGLSRAEIEATLAALRDLLNAYEGERLGKTTFYEEIVPFGSDGNALISRLKEADAYRAAELGGRVERQMWKRGDYGDA